jgi:hypothetical protein
MTSSVRSAEASPSDRYSGAIEIDDPIPVSRSNGRSTGLAPPWRLRVREQADGMVRTCRSSIAAPHPSMLRRALRLRRWNSSVECQRVVRVNYLKGIPVIVWR